MISEHRGKEILCCEGRGNIERYNENVVAFDSYINFIPRQGETPGLFNDTFPSFARPSNWENGKMVFSFDPYDEAAEEYYEYRHGRKEERQPEVVIDVPVKTETSNGLDYERMQLWWTLVNKSSDIQYKYFSSNCAYATVMALRAGGSDQYLKWEDKIFPVTPLRAARHAGEIAKSIGQQKASQMNQTDGKGIFDGVIRYVKRLVLAIDAADKIPDDLLEIKINENIGSNKFLEMLSKVRKHDRAIDKICMLVRDADNAKDIITRYKRLHKIEDQCARYLFKHPDSQLFNLIASMMVKIDIEKNDDFLLWCDAADPRRQLLAELLAYSHSNDRKFGIFKRDKKRDIVQTFFKKCPNPSLDQLLQLKEDLKKSSRRGYSNDTVDKLIKITRSSS